MVTYPWYSRRPGTTVYHNNTACTEGNNVEILWRTPGTGNLKLCHHCTLLGILKR